MSDKYGAYFRTISIILDLILLNLSGLAGYAVSIIFRTDQLHLGLLHFLLVNFIWFNVTQSTKLYRNLFAKDAIPTIKEALGSLVLFGVLVGLLIETVTEFHCYSIVVVTPFLFFCLLLLCGKIGFLLWRRSSRSSLIDYKDIIILGAGSVGIELKNYLDSHPILGYKVRGFFDDITLPTNCPLTLLGGLDSCVNYAKQHKIKEVFCALPDSSIAQIQILMRQADQEMIRFKMVPDVKDYFKKNVKVQWFGHMPVFSARKEPLEIKLNQILKRTFDILVSLIAIIFLLSWIFPLFSVLIVLSSRGPVLFRQLRSGKNNEPFYCLKFRSMIVNDQSDSLQAVKDDSRVTRIGAFMRKNSIDELPQFINVLLGDMSVVGPRPHMLQHTAAYADLIDQFMVRHLVLPGITGWAQTRGLRGETSDHKALQERVIADIWYLENWSLLLDLKIVFLTVWHIIVGSENAY